MKLTTKDDIDAPIAFVFAQISDFPAFERMALRHGANLKRIDSLPAPGVGSIWQAVVPFRGKERDIRVELTGIQAPEAMTLQSKSGGLDSETTIRLIALSRTQTRLALDIELKPTNLTSRLLVQSFKLAKGTITGKLQTRLSGFARDLQDRYKRSNGA